MPLAKKQKKEMTFQEARELAGNVHLAYYILSAIKLNISYKVIIPSLFVEFQKGKKKWRIHKALTPINNAVATSLASYKNNCNFFLRSQNFPVPAQELVSSADAIFEFKKKHKAEDIVIKPKRGFGGAGVSIQPKTEQEIRQAYNFAREECMAPSEPKVVVEEFIHGKHYRMVILDDKLIAASERMAPYVIGDGTSNISTLIAEKNIILGQKGRSKIRLDDEAKKAIAEQQFKITSIPEKDARITVRFNANMTSGGSTRECLSEVHPKYSKLAISVVQAVGLKLGGIDLITPDITNFDVKFGINEVNHNPGLRIHYMPNHGEPVDIATTIQQYILDNIE